MKIRGIVVGVFFILVLLAIPFRVPHVSAQVVTSLSLEEQGNALLKITFQQIWIPPKIQNKIRFRLLMAKEVPVLGYPGAIGQAVLQGDGTVLIKLALLYFQRDDGSWDSKVFADYLAHEIGHAVWFIGLNFWQQDEFRKVTPKLHEQSYFDIADPVRQRYAWSTHREEFFAESYKVLYCRTCSLTIITHWQFPVTQEVKDFFRTNVGPLLRDPSERETTP